MDEEKLINTLYCSSNAKKKCLDGGGIAVRMERQKKKKKFPPISQSKWIITNTLVAWCVDGTVSCTKLVHWNRGKAAKMEILKLPSRKKANLPIIPKGKYSYNNSIKNRFQSRKEKRKEKLPKLQNVISKLMITSSFVSVSLSLPNFHFSAIHFFLILRGILSPSSTILLTCFIWW